VSQSSAATDISGLASIVPSAGAFSAPVEVDVAVAAGTSALLDYPLELLPSPTGSDHSTGTLPSRIGNVPIRILGPGRHQESEPTAPARLTAHPGERVGLIEPGFVSK